MENVYYKYIYLVRVRFLDMFIGKWLNIHSNQQQVLSASEIKYDEIKYNYGDDDSVGDIGVNDVMGIIVVKVLVKMVVVSLLLLMVMMWWWLLW